LIRQNLLIIVLLLVMVAAPSTTAQEATQTPESVPPGLTIHVVQRGENLFRIALRYNTSTAELAELNGISNTSSIQVGQRLLVPSQGSIAETPQTHIVQPGESLFTIAQLYSVSVEALLAANEIANANQLYPGQELTITDEAPANTPTAETTAAVSPGDILPTPEAPLVAANDLPTVSSNIHVVQPGETLFRIATSYGLTTNELASANGISDPTRIYAGQQLVIPNLEESPAAALDLPAPISNLVVDPLTFVEGETGVFQLTTQVASTVTGEFLGQPLNFITQADGTQHLALVGIPVFTDAGVYPVTLFTSAQDGTQTEFAFNVRIGAGPYGTQNLNVSAENLLAPAVQDNEFAVLRSVVSRVTAERYHEGLLSIPAAAAMNSPFGTRRSYNSGPVNAFHSGADFASAPNTPIFAAGSGVVVLADALNIRGNTIIIDHGWGIYTLYAHLTSFSISLGDTVSTNQVIGTAGSTGRVTGPHLHWEVWVNGVPVNPIPWTQRTFP
jgi:murein DD-endopeptidase MepM/ murein hydrolase activator NlpD